MILNFIIYVMIIIKKKRLLIVKKNVIVKFKIVELWKLNANLNHLSGVNEGLMYFSKQLFIKNSKKFLRLVQSFKLFLHIKLKMRKKIKTTEFKFNKC